MIFLKKEERLVYFIYLFVYLFSVFLYLADGYVHSDLRGMPLNQAHTMWLSFLQVIIGVFLFMSFTSIILRTVNIPSFREYNGSFLHYGILALNIVFIFFSIQYQIGFSGVEQTNNIPKLVQYFFIILQPFYITVIYLAYFSREDSNLYTLNLFVVTAFNLYQGWLAPLLYLALIFFYEYKEYILRNKLRLLMLVLLVILLAPFLKFFKDVFLIYNQSEIMTVMDGIITRLEFLEINTLGDFLSFYLSKTLGRFDHVAITYYANILDSSLLSDVRAVYQEGWLGERLSPDKPYLQRVIATHFETRYEYQVQVPITTRLILYPHHLASILLYSASLIVANVLLIKLITPKSRAHFLVWFSSFFIIYHGWYYDAILFIHACISFAFILFILHVIHASTTTQSH